MYHKHVQHDLSSREASVCEAKEVEKGKRGQSQRTFLLCLSLQMEIMEGPLFPRAPPISPYFPIFIDLCTMTGANNSKGNRERKKIREVELFESVCRLHEREKLAKGKGMLRGSEPVCRGCTRLKTTCNTHPSSSSPFRQQVYKIWIVALGRQLKQLQGYDQRPFGESW